MRRFVTTSIMTTVLKIDEAGSDPLESDSIPVFTHNHSIMTNTRICFKVRVLAAHMNPCCFTQEN